MTSEAPWPEVLLAVQAALQFGARTLLTVSVVMFGAYLIVLVGSLVLHAATQGARGPHADRHAGGEPPR